MSVGLLDHFNIRTRKLADTVRFYEEVLEFENGDRPNFSFPGAWMYSEGKPVVHIVDISKTDEQQKPDPGCARSPKAHLFDRPFTFNGPGRSRPGARSDSARCAGYPSSCPATGRTSRSPAPCSASRSARTDSSGATRRTGSDRA